MDSYHKIKNLYIANADPIKAISMARYMRNQFCFYGVPAPQRQKLQMEVFENAENMLNWDFLQLCYDDPYREFQYTAVDMLVKSKKHLHFEDAERLKTFITAKSWWDTVDSYHSIFAELSLKNSNTSELMLKWSKDRNIWVRRTAIIHQLSLKDHTDFELLSEIILNNVGSAEFFINKAIGWSLREYAKTNPQWVLDFLDTYGNQLSSLSVREAMRHLKKQ